MRTQFKSFSIALSLGFLLFGFQNCGDQVDFSSIEYGDSNTKIDSVNELTQEDAQKELDELLEELPPIEEASPNDPKIPGIGDVPIDIDDPDRFSRICVLAQFLVMNRVTSETSIVNLSGAHLIGAKELEKVENVSGLLIIVGVGLTNSRHIESMNNVSGTKLVCGMSIGSLTNVSGNTIIIKGEVGDIDNHSGNLLLIRSPHTGSATNISGRFVQF